MVVDGIEPAVVEHMVGSGSLLVRDAEGRFSFVHRSVLEWLVAASAAREVEEKGDAAALGADEMSELMADFFISLAGRETAGQWARDQTSRGAEEHAKKNAAKVRRRIEVRFAAPGAGELDVPVTMDLDGQDLRGQDWSKVDWQGASLARADLRGATLREADLRGASLVGAKLGRAGPRGGQAVGGGSDGDRDGVCAADGRGSAGCPGALGGEAPGGEASGGAGGRGGRAGRRWCGPAGAAGGRTDVGVGVGVQRRGVEPFRRPRGQWP